MRNTFAKVALAAAVIFGMQLSAQATSLGNVSGTTTFTSVTDPGNFSDTFSFTADAGLTGATDSAGLIASSVSFATYGTTVSSLALYVGSYSDYSDLAGLTPISPATIVSASKSGVATSTNLTTSAELIAGQSYTIAITGSSIGTAGFTGIVALTSPAVMAAVPEPESYAMLLAGLGMMGFIARRRQKNR